MIVTHNTVGNSPAKPYKSTIVEDSAGAEPKNNYKAFNVESTISWPDPAAYTESETEDVNYLSDARMDIVNNAKIPDICIGSPFSSLEKYVADTGNTNLLVDSPFGNWRDKSLNNFATISSRVYLRDDELLKNIKHNVKYSLQDAKKLTSSGLIKMLTGLANTANQVAEAASIMTGKDFGSAPGDYGTVYQGWVADPSGTTSHSIDKLTFTFSFGQAQIFSAEEEVVKPILALANIFMPKLDGHRVITPYLSVARARSRVAAYVFKGVSSTIGGGIGGIMSGLPDGADIVQNGGAGLSGTVGNVLEKINNITDAVMSGTDKALAEALSASKSITVRLGPLILGPFMPESINWDFDFNDVDEFGYPCSGKIEFSGLKLPTYPTAGKILRQWGYNTKKQSIDEKDTSTKENVTGISTDFQVASAVDN